MSAFDLRNTPMVLLDDSRPAHLAGRSLLFHSPEHVIVAHNLNEIGPALEAMDQARAAGLHLAGWIAYECNAYFEPRIAAQNRPLPEEPLIWMMVTRHRQELDTAALATLFNTSRHGTNHFANLKIGKPKHDEADYKTALDRVHSYIQAGDVYQINHTFPLPLELEGDAIALYEQLRESQPVPYGAYIDTGPDYGGHKILSLSPELFIRREGNKLQAKPMKGTAARGITYDQDRQVEIHLQQDEKSKAENLMIVDLIRNDLSRIAKTGSVSVPNLFETEQYPSLFQMTSTVRAETDSELAPSDLLKALFPCGSVTGAPKVRAMEIINELEGRPRGVYCGAIGHFSSADTGADWALNVPIRTLILNKSNEGRISVGSGVVADSNSHGEYEECLLKARFLEAAPTCFSLIETMKLDEQGEFTLLDEHLSRLEKSAAYFDFAYDDQKIRNHLAEHRLAFDAGLQPRRVRLLVGRSGAVTVSSSELPTECKDKNLRVGISHKHVRSDDPFLFHKTTHRRLYDQAFAKAQNDGLADVLFFNERDELTEGAISNVFIVRNKQWFTPAVHCGLLDGVFRRHFMATNTPPIEERVIRKDDLEKADEIYIANSVRGLRRVKIEWNSS